jgi:hypothetical protein
MPVERAPWVKAEYERIARERMEAEKEVERTYRGELVKVCLQCIGSCLAGMALLGVALHVTDHAIGMIFWWGGFVVGYSGITLALARAYLRGVERGDW